VGVPSARRGDWRRWRGGVACAFLFRGKTTGSRADAVSRPGRRRSQIHHRGARITGCRSLTSLFRWRLSHRLGSRGGILDLPVDVLHRDFGHWSLVLHAEVQDDREDQQQGRRERHGHSPAWTLVDPLGPLTFDGIARLAQHDTVELFRRLEWISRRAPEHGLAPREKVVEFVVRAGHVTSSTTAMAALSLPTA